MPKLLPPEAILRKYTGQPSYKVIGVFNVGGVFPYEVRQTRKVMYQGEEVDALWDRDSMVIWISTNQHKLNQKSALKHELKHAWESHFPGTRDYEQDAEWTGSFGVWFNETAKQYNLI